MTLTLDIQRSEGLDIQVKCFIDDNLIPEFFSYGNEWMDEDIESTTRQKLTDMGYSFS